MYPHHRHQREKPQATCGSALDLCFWGPIIPWNQMAQGVCYHSLSFQNTTFRFFNPTEGSVPSGHAPMALVQPQ